MTSALKFGIKEHVHDLSRKTCTDNSAAHAQHVRVVVQSGVLRGIPVAAERSAYSLYLVRRNGNAYACAADEYCLVGLPGSYLLSGFIREIGVVDALAIAAADDEINPL